MKRVLVVRGSHDGNLGVYTNVKWAYERAKEYFGTDKYDMTYPNVVKACKNWGCTIYSLDDYTTSVQIEVFYINQ